MSAVYLYQPESKCGYKFRENRARTQNCKILTIPEPYSKTMDSGEEIVLTDEEVEAWNKAYEKAVDELGVKYDSEDEAVYKRVDEILRETGNYRFLQ